MIFGKRLGIQIWISGAFYLPLFYRWFPGCSPTPISSAAPLKGSIQAKLSLLEHCMVGCLNAGKKVATLYFFLPGVLTAEGLAQVFADLFGGVVYAGIDTDRFK